MGKYEEPSWIKRWNHELKTNNLTIEDLRGFLEHRRLEQISLKNEKENPFHYYLS